ncbi:MAG: amino acid adenylation domain-containing protein [Myxococcota bacterium]
MAELQAAAAADPDAPAVRQGERVLSRAALVAEVAGLAGALRRRGVRAGDRVACCARRTPDLVVALWATWWLGAVWVPVDPSHPADRRRALLDDAGARIVLDDEAVRERETAVCPARTDPSQLAYLMFTSGSTGRPKGVAVEHDQLANFFVGMDAALGRGPGTWLAVTTASFDISLLELAWAVTRGYAVAVAPELRPEARAGDDRRALAAIAAEARPTHLQCTPSLARLLLAEPAFRDAARGSPCGWWAASACPRLLVRELRAAAPSARLVDAYGPTETTIWSTTHPLEDVDAEPVPIGRPIANTTVHVLDRAQRPVPPGVPGELWIGGRGVARGYLDQPALTADRFRPGPGGRLYRTGDRVVLGEDGALRFLGRVDDQIKLRGHRIEPGEVEAALGACPGAGAVAVGLRHDAAEAPVLVAWTTGDADPAALRAHALQQLPAVMVPAHWVGLDALPLGPSGKVDRAALPWAPPAPSAPAGGTLLDAVVAAFARALGAADVPPDASFFELGGHSLAAVEAATALRAVDPGLPLDAVFRHPTARELAAALGCGAAAGPQPGAPPTVSLAQEQLWLLHRLAPPGLYDHAFLLSLRGRAPDLAPRLGAALDRVVARHEVLRTAFVDADGRPRAVVHDTVPTPLVAVDLRGEPDPTRTLADDVARRRGASFDPAQPPLLALALYRLAEDEHALLVVVHHLVWDGASAAVLGRELSALLAHPDAALPPLPLQARDHARWQRERLDGADGEALVAWWREALPPAPPLALVPDRPAPPAPTWAGGEVPVALPPALVAGLGALARGEGATLFMALLAAFQVVLGRQAQQEDVRVGFPVANRADPALAALVGYFVNVLVARGDLAGDPPFRALLRRTRDATLGALAHQDLPLARLVAALPVDRSASSPLFQALFVLQERHEAPLAVPGLTVARLDLPEPLARYEVTLTLSPRDGGLVGTLGYRADRFRAPTARRWVAQLVALLEAAVAAPDRPLSALAPPPAVALPDPGAPAPERPLHALFLDHAARAPDAPALVTERGVVTYAALRAQAAGVAAAVREAPPGPCRAGGAGGPRTGRARGDARRPLRDRPAAGPAARPPGRAPRRRRPRARPHRDALASLRPGEAVRVVDVDLDAPAYVAYTSGSTGRPKGIVGTHRSFAQLVAWQAEAFDVGPGARVAVWAPVAYDAHLCELLGALCTGAAAVVAPAAIRGSPGAMARWVDAERITWFQTVPSFCAPWLREVRAAGLPLRALRCVTVSGEVLPPSLARAWHEGGAPARLVNLFGPSEAVLATFHPVDAAPEGDAPVPVGRPLPGRDVLLCDARGAPVPAGAPGEIVLCTRYAAAGYLGQPDETAATFVPAGDGRVRLRTGDRGRLGPDGALWFLGRGDRLVKVRGNRVELGEVEAAARGCPGVDGCHAALRDARLILWFDGPAGADALRAHLGAVLPATSLPDRCVRLARLPRTATGKVDPAALPEPPPSAGPPPATALEDRIAGVWREVLGVARVGRDDSFFDLGGQSLALAEVHARLQRSLDRELALLTLFRFPTVAQLAAHLDGQAARAAAPTPDPSRRRAALRTLHQRRQGGDA